MTDYAQLTFVESILMTFLVVISLFAGIPALLMIFKKGKYNFLASMLMMSLICSLLHHLGQIYSFSFFLSRIQWQRVNNIFTIASFQLILLFMWGVLHEQTHILQYSTLISTIIVQQDDPWNFKYTAYPIIFYLFLGFALKVMYRQKLSVVYLKKNMALALLFLIVGIIFYLDGLDQSNDYLRFSHGVWHFCCSIFGWYVFDAIQVTVKAQKIYKSKIIPDSFSRQGIEKQA